MSARPRPGARGRAAWHDPAVQIAIALLSIVATAAPCPPGVPTHHGAVRIQSDEDVDRAGLTGVVCLEGDLVVGGAVRTLQPLAGLRIIAGHLRVDGSRALRGLQGLEAVEQVRG